MRNRADNDLWILCARGNRDACAILFARHHQLFYSYASKLTTNRFLINDTVQELFVSVLTGDVKEKNLLNLKSVKVYMLRVLRFKLIDNIKKENKYTDLDHLDMEMQSQGNDSPSDERIPIVLEAFKTLTPRQREIISLFYQKEMTHKEICIILDINYQSSVTLLLRSLNALRKAIIINEQKAKYVSIVLMATSYN